MHIQKFWDTDLKTRTYTPYASSAPAVIDLPVSIHTIGESGFLQFPLLCRELAATS